MDLFFLKYDINEEMVDNVYSWHEILFALKNNIITSEAVIDYASYILNENIIGFDTVIEIACLNSDEDIYPYLNKLIEIENSQTLSEVKGRWLYLILKWLFKNRYVIENVFEVVEEIYFQFDYPECISSFVRYLPSETGDLGSPELNRERLFKNWANYLELFESEREECVFNE